MLFLVFLFSILIHESQLETIEAKKRSNVGIINKYPWIAKIYSSEIRNFIFWKFYSVTDVERMQILQ